MAPDLRERVPREILEIIEEGTEVFRSVLEKLFNVAMQVERSEFLGAVREDVPAAWPCQRLQRQEDPKPSR